MSDILKITTGVVLAQMLRAVIIASLMKMQHWKTCAFWATVRGVY